MTMQNNYYISAPALVPEVSVNRKEAPSNGRKAKINTNSSNKISEWEFSYLGDFLLQMQHGGFLKRDSWTIQKSIARSKFNQYVKDTSTENLTPELKVRLQMIQAQNCVGTCLRTTGYLWNTPPDCGYYRICTKKFFNHRFQRLKEIDEKQRNDEPYKFFLLAKDEKDQQKVMLPKTPIVSGPQHFLIYRGTQKQIRSNFLLSNTGCYICQENFNSMIAYEEHFQYHNEDSDFKSLENMIKEKSPAFSICYQLCVDSHLFCFTLIYKNSNSGLNFDQNGDSIIVEKIIIVQSQSIFYVHNNQVPFELKKNSPTEIFIDSNIFRRFAEQPVIVIYQYKDNPNVRYIEQHHFIRKEEFPSIHFGVNPRRLSSKVQFKTKVKIPPFDIVSEIRAAYRKNQIKDYFSNKHQLFREYIKNVSNLDAHNYNIILKNLLTINDVALINDYLNLSQTKVKLVEYESTYLFKLEKLDSKNTHIRPSLSDEVILTKETGDTRKKMKVYMGFITNVTNKTVTFKCDKIIPLQDTYNIVFRPNRSFVRHQYYALSLFRQTLSIEEANRHLFPQDIWPLSDNEIQKIAAIELKLNNPSVSSNPEQLLAVKQILYGPRKDAPFIIFGPPGTGKTTTLVEAVYQLFVMKPKSKILITAGSNSACDEIALRLCKILSQMDDTKSIIRIYSRSCEFRQENINDLLLEYSNMYNGQFYPDIDVLHEYRIIICTLSVVGKLICGNFGKTASNDSIFTHIVIDEAGTLTETETLVPIVFCTSPTTRLILGGDYKQLGAVLHSSIAQELGFDKSLLERLMDRKCYQVNDMNQYDTSIQIRLIRNYRSHPKIVQQFNRLFYGKTILPMLENDDDCYRVGRTWHLSPNTEYPIIFHSVFGQALKRQNSSSLYNREELFTVLDYVKDLMYFGIRGKKVSQKDIGIISPYKSQYLEIQEQLNLCRWTDIETGSVETFQGREKQIIIVSFVRSSDVSLGFLDSPNRLNVAISRAKSFLILIGHPKTLSLSRELMDIMKACKENKTFLGRRFDLELKQPESVCNSTKSSMEQLNTINQVPRNMKSNETINIEAKENNKNGFSRRRRGNRGGGRNQRHKSNDNQNNNDNKSNNQTINIDSILTMPLYKTLNPKNDDELTNKMKNLNLSSSANSNILAQQGNESIKKISYTVPELKHIKSNVHPLTQVTARNQFLKTDAPNKITKLQNGTSLQPQSSSIITSTTVNNKNSAQLSNSSTSPHNISTMRSTSNTYSFSSYDSERLRNNHINVTDWHEPISRLRMHSNLNNFSTEKSKKSKSSCTIS